MQLHLFTLSITQHGSQSLHVQEKISNWNTIITATGTQWNTGTRWTRYGKILNLPDIIIPCIANENFPNCINLSVDCRFLMVKIENDTYKIDTESRLEESYCEYWYCLTMNGCSSSYSSLVYYQCYNNKTNIENCTMYKDFANSSLCFNVSAFMERYGNQSTICIKSNDNSYEETFDIGKIKLICTTIYNNHHRN